MGWQKILKVSSSKLWPALNVIEPSYNKTLGAIFWNLGESISLANANSLAGGRSPIILNTVFAGMGCELRKDK